MTITQEQIKKISKNLAKLAPKNEERLARSMSSILEYIDLLNEVDTTGVPATISVIHKQNQALKADQEARNIAPIELLKCSGQKIIANQIAISDIMK